MRQAIRTTYLAPTDTKGARIRAKCDARTVSVPWQHDLDVPGNHVVAARYLMRLMGWEAALETGSLGNEYYHVMREDR